MLFLTDFSPQDNSLKKDVLARFFANLAGIPRFEVTGPVSITLYAIDLEYGLLKIPFLQWKYVCKAQKVSFRVICDKEIFLLGK